MNVINFEFHVDGAAKPNPGKGGFAGVLQTLDEMHNPVVEEIFQSRCYKLTTNNRMELKAVIDALRWIRKNRSRLGGKEIVVCTDSGYICNNLFNVVYMRKRGDEGWMNNGREIKNRDLWKELLSVYVGGYYVGVEKVPRRSCEGSKKADDLSKEARECGIYVNDYGYKPGFVTRSKMKGIAAKLFDVRGQEEIIRVEGSALIGKQEEIKFLLCDMDKNEYEGKYTARVLPQEEQELHRTHHYRVKFNSDTRNPMIDQVIEEVDIGDFESE